MRPITAVVVASAAVLLFGCEGSGSPTDNQSVLQCQALQASQDANNYSNCLSFTGGGGGGSGTGANSAGLAPAALYKLVKVNGAALPVNLMPGGVEDSTTTDSTRVIDFILDSSYISLNTDSSVTRIDYIYVRDRRSGATNPSTICNVTPVFVADTSFGAFSDSSGQPEIELLSGFQIQNVGWQYTGDTLTATTPYELHDSGCLPTQIITSAYFTYQNIGAPLNNALRAAPGYRSSRAAMSTTPIRQSRVGGPGLSFMRSDDGGGRLVRVIGQ